MRLLKLGIYHPEYLKEFYAERPALAAQSFAQQHAALIGDCYGSSDFWTRALSPLGYETGDTIANAGPLQKRWATENGVRYEESEWVFAITAAQVKAFRPDVLIVADYSTFTADFLRQLKRECSSLRLILGWCGAPYNDPAVFREWDIVLSCVPEMVDQFRADGHHSYHINHAFEPRILDKLGAAETPNSDFTFLGSVLKQNRFHVEREQILAHLVEHTGLQIWSDIKTPSRLTRPAQVRRFARATLTLGQAVVSSNPLQARGGGNATRPAPSTAIDQRIARRAHPPLFGLAMFQQLRAGKVALNTHIDISPVSASNMRLFEATGVGTCLLTDWKKNLPELFEPDVEVLTYRNAAECVDKVRYILNNEKERAAVAAAGQRRTLRDHTFTGRAAQIDEIIRGALSRPPHKGADAVTC